ncbi:MAG: hypothetical protein JW939_05995 [Candidatus Thermoplasmatota archaeon]|nr:hypothetical protein [Candidatus Thermoplasmatota archaeon]
MALPPSSWRAAVCYDALSISRIVRETLDGLGWKYERDRTVHSFNRLWVAISMPAVSYVFQFIVSEPVELVINVYEERPNHAAELHFLELKGVNSKNAPKVRKFLQAFASSLPKKPYNFHWTERFRAGLLNRHQIDSRKEWGRWGI